jgi:hypothetical protein
MKSRTKQVLVLGCICNCLDSLCQCFLMLQKWVIGPGKIYFYFWMCKVEDVGIYSYLNDIHKDGFPNFFFILSSKHHHQLIFLYPSIFCGECCAECLRIHIPSDNLFTGLKNTKQIIIIMQQEWKCLQKISIWKIHFSHVSLRLVFDVSLLHVGKSKSKGTFNKSTVIVNIQKWTNITFQCNPPRRNFNIFRTTWICLIIIKRIFSPSVIISKTWNKLIFSLV